MAQENTKVGDFIQIVDFPPDAVYDLPMGYENALYVVREVYDTHIVAEYGGYNVVLPHGYYKVLAHNNKIGWFKRLILKWGIGLKYVKRD